jgi:SAM-dependent methyltransferase
MKINFGAGGNILVGWKNHDAEVNICGHLPYADGVADFILIEHCVEHVSAPDGFRFMEEAHRILNPGGVLRICVPHLGRIVDRAHCRDLIVGNGHLVVFNLPLLVTLLQLAGFETVNETGRKPCDGHWRVIGEDRDDLETLRVEAHKAK